MKKTADTKSPKNSVFTTIFFISLFYYVIWLVISIILAIIGVDSGWAMPAMSNGELDYGWEAFQSGIAIGLIATAVYFWLIPLYQIIYLIVMIVKKCRQKNQDKIS